MQRCARACVIGVDAGCDAGGPLGREQRFEDALRHRARVGQPAVPLGQRRARRFEPEMDPGRIGHPVRVERRRRRRGDRAQHVEQRERDRTAAVGRMARRLDAAIRRPDRCRPVGRVGRQVAGPDARAAGRQICRCTRREGPVVDGPGSFVGDPAERRGQAGYDDDLAVAPGTVSGPERARPVGVGTEDSAPNVRPRPASSRTPESPRQARWPAPAGRTRPVDRSAHGRRPMIGRRRRPSPSRALGGAAALRWPPEQRRGSRRCRSAHCRSGGSVSRPSQTSQKASPPSPHE